MMLRLFAVLACLSASGAHAQTVHGDAFQRLYKECDCESGRPGCRWCICTASETVLRLSYNELEAYMAREDRTTQRVDKALEEATRICARRGFGD